MLKYLVVMVGLLSARPAAAQADSVLKGISKVRAVVDLTWNDRISPLSKDRAQLTLDSRFTLELRKLGLIVSEDAPLEVRCVVGLYVHPQIALNVIYATEVFLVEPAAVPRISGYRQALTWRGLSYVGAIGQDGLQAVLGDKAQDCAESFGNAWLAANPKH